MNWETYIHSDPNILVGKPVIKGTRLSVEFILGLLSIGWTEQQLLENYPTLTPESITYIIEDLEDLRDLRIAKQEESNQPSLSFQEVAQQLKLQP